jgi:hypothetical protein
MAKFWSIAAGTIGRNIIHFPVTYVHITHSHGILLSDEGPILCLPIDLVTPDGPAQVVRMHPERERVKRVDPGSDLALHVPEL